MRTHHAQENVSFSPRQSCGREHGPTADRSLDARIAAALVDNVASDKGMAWQGLASDEDEPTPQARCVIRLSDRDESLFVYVDAIDYPWLARWRWSYTWNRQRTAFYATRVTTLKDRRDVKLYMHKVILRERMMIEPPTPAHTVGDHADRNTANNCRVNLRWFTKSQNRLNSRDPAR